MRFNPPPSWPTPPAGWTPPQGWQPDPSWGPVPAGWQLWLPDDPATSAPPIPLTLSAPAVPGAGPTSTGQPGPFPAGASTSNPPHPGSPDPHPSPPRSGMSGRRLAVLGGVAGVVVIGLGAGLALALGNDDPTPITDPGPTSPSPTAEPTPEPTTPEPTPTTAEPTSTPEPTPSPTPEPPPAPDPQPSDTVITALPDQDVTGTGPALVQFSELGDTPWVLTWQHAESGLYTLSTTEEWIGPDSGLITAGFGDGNGRYPFNIYANQEERTSLYIEARGAWTVKLTDLFAQPSWDGSSTYTGTDSEVLIVWDVPAPLDVGIWHDGTSNFQVHASGQGLSQTLVNEVGAWDSRATLPDGAQILTVKADGNWHLAP